MSEQATESRRPDWTKRCPFFEIFRTFRMAIHPSKLGLALIGVVLIGLWGSLLDGIWPETRQPVAGELNAFWQVPDINMWRTQTRDSQTGRLRAIYAEAGITPPSDTDTHFRDDPIGMVNIAKTQLKKRYHDLTRNTDSAQTAQVARDFNGLYGELDTLRPTGIFCSLVSNQVGLARQAIEAAYSLNFMGRLHEVVTARQGLPPPPDTELGNVSGVGVVPTLFLMLRAKQWLITQHFFYFLLLAAAALLVWALIGGAICRMAALNVAREERISPRVALQFAGRKYLSFLTAPLLPLAIIVIIGIALFVGGFVIMAIPYIGELLGGLLLGLGLLGGFVIALVVMGALVGGPLFFPTIAVEGSDSFDAMSRSYSYVYSKPWRAVWYWVVAFFYGSLCYLFVRVFAFIMLKATRAFTDMGTAVWTHRPGTGSPANTKLDAMWASPTFDSFRHAPAPFGMMHWEAAGSWLIGLWVLLVVALLAAFVISFYLCASTIIYYLLRREVDATDLEEVYVDEEEPEEAALSPAPAGGAATSAPAAPASSPPPAEPPPVEPPSATGGEPTP
jgi:hypothetical protein